MWNVSRWPPLCLERAAVAGAASVVAYCRSKAASLTQPSSPQMSWKSFCTLSFMLFIALNCLLPFFLTCFIPVFLHLLPFFHPSFLFHEFGPNVFLSLPACFFSFFLICVSPLPSPLILFLFSSIHPSFLPSLHFPHTPHLLTDIASPIPETSFFAHALMSISVFLFSWLSHFSPSPILSLSSFLSLFLS